MIVEKLLYVLRAFGTFRENLKARQHSLLLLLKILLILVNTCVRNYAKWLGNYDGDEWWINDQLTIPQDEVQVILQYTFAQAFRSLYIAMLPTNKKNQALRDVNYNNKDSKGMFNKKIEK